MYEGYGKVLVVEADEDVRQLLKEELEAFGYEVLAAGSAQEGIDISTAANGDIGIAIVDYRMESELFERLAETRPTARLIRMSPYSSNPDARWTMLRKPFTQMRLRIAIARATLH